MIWSANKRRHSMIVFWWPLCPRLWIRIDRAAFTPLFMIISMYKILGIFYVFDSFYKDNIQFLNPNQKRPYRYLLPECTQTCPSLVRAVWARNARAPPPPGQKSSARRRGVQPGLRGPRFRATRRMILASLRGTAAPTPSHPASSQSRLEPVMIIRNYCE